MRLLRRSRNRKVLIQLKGAAAPTIEGVLVGRCDGHYIVWAPKIAEGPERTQPISGHVEVPVENVLFFQVIG